MSSTESGKATVMTSRIAKAACLVLFAGGLAGWLSYLPGPQAPRAWRALLVNFAYFTPLSGGLVVWSAVVLASHGRWMGELEGITARGAGFAVPSIVALCGLWAGCAKWAPWYNVTLHQGFWLNSTFVFARALGVLVVFWALAWLYIRRRKRGLFGAFGAILIVVYALAFSLLAFDLLMPLQPEWYSTLFGMYYFVSGMYAAIVMWTLISAWRGDTGKERLRDLATLVVTFSLLTTYMMFSQLIVLWYENLPGDTAFLVPRMNFRWWTWVSAGLVVLVYLGPLFMLLTRWAKTTRVALVTITAILLVGLWAERWWLVSPAFELQPQFGLIELSISVSFAALWALSFAYAYPRMPDAFPVKGG